MRRSCFLFNRKCLVARKRLPIKALLENFGFVLTHVKTYVIIDKKISREEDAKSPSKDERRRFYNVNN